MIINKIQAYLDSNGHEIPEAILEEVSLLARWSFERQFGIKKEFDRKLRLSSIGKCQRQQAYNILGYENNGKEIDARAKTVFFQGDMAEMAIVQLAKVAGCNLIDCGKEQKTVSLYGVPGHPDGIFINEFNQKFLLEVKSMSSFSFADFTRGEINEDYLYQINAYLEAMDLEECVMVGLNKDAGVLHEHLVKRNPAIVQKIKNNIKLLSFPSKDHLPEQGFSPDEKGFLPWNCLYCSFYKTCRPNAELVLIKNKYKLQEKENATTSI